MTGAVRPPERIRIAARLLVAEAGRILVARFTAGGYDFLPGGGVDPGEAAAQAAARELEEETGIARDRVRILHPLGVLEHSWVEGDRVQHEMDVVLAASVEGLRAGDPVPSREPHLTFGWRAEADLPHTRFEPAALVPLLKRWRGPAAFASDMAARQGACVVVSDGNRPR
jgi:8-oxo-dGTP pyrophosphatase MutT (NUDIX family)